MATRQLLDYLRSRSFVDCDALNVSIAEQLGPFQDSTSNQAIAYFELQETSHKQLIHDAIELSQKLSGKYDAVQAVDIAMTMLALRMLPHLRGTTHIQVNPFHSHSTSCIIDNAKAIISYARAIEPSIDTSRLCVKIPSTWEGLMACQVLEEGGVKTLATTLFCPEQAALAGRLGCSYIAPYVNELRVHFDSGFKDADPGFSVVAWAQAYFRMHDFKTQVMPASLTSIKEVMALAGAHHITVAPHLLQKLQDTAAGENVLEQYPSVFDKATKTPDSTAESIKDEESFKEALDKGGNGQNGRKLKEVGRDLT